ncbi:MAG: twin-arginine translocation signal domain-containing protein [Acidimicrobiales bacterium]
MSEITRRTFLKQSGATAAAAGAMVAVPKGLSRLQPTAAKPAKSTAARSAASAAAAKKAATERQLVVHVPDTGSGELRVMVGDRRVVIQDRELVTRLQRATD